MLLSLVFLKKTHNNNKPPGRYCILSMQYIQVQAVKFPRAGVFI